MGEQRPRKADGSLVSWASRPARHRAFPVLIEPINSINGIKRLDYIYLERFLVSKVEQLSREAL